MQEFSLGSLKAIEVGESVDYPISMLLKVRNYCSAYGATWNRVYTTKLNRQQNVITVKRTL